MVSRCDFRKSFVFSMFLGVIALVLWTGMPAGAVEDGSAQTLQRTDNDERTGEYIPEEGGRREARMRKYLRSRINPDTGMLDLEGLEAAWRHKETMSSAAADGSITAGQQSVAGDFWVNLGPKSFIPTRGGPMSGRIRTIAPVSATEVFVGGALGGVWKTTNGGGHWEPKSDFEKSLAMGSIAVDPDDSRIIYAGTGEMEAAAGVGYGAGLLRSIDGGDRWTPLGIPEFSGGWISQVLLDPRSISKPEIERKVYVAASTGFWKSLDSGKSWGRLLPGKFSDAVFDSANPAIVYAAQWGGGIFKVVEGSPLPSGPLTDLNGKLPTSRFGRINLAATMDPAFNTPMLFATMQDYVVHNAIKGVWSSNNGGTRWIRLGGAPPSFGDGSLIAQPNSYESEPNDAISQPDANPVGEVIEGAISSSGDVDYFTFTTTGNYSFSVEILADRAGTGLAPRLQLYDSAQQLKRDVLGNLPKPVGTGTSKDGRFNGWQLTAGTYYVRVSSADGSTGAYQLSVSGVNPGSQANYNQVIAVEPNNPNVLYLGEVVLWRSDDGGTNWTFISDHSGNNVIHNDVHTIEFYPGTPTRLLVGCDGGIWESSDRGNTWVSRNGDLSITQHYSGISLHPTDPDFILVGNQDNGSLRYQNGVWTQVAGGDGGYTAIESHSTWYVTENHLNVRKTTDNAATSPVSKTTGLERGAADLIAPMVKSPSEPRVLIAGGGKGPAGPPIVAVYRTNTGGDSWFVNSNELSNQRLITLAFAPSDTRYYYAGSITGHLFRTTDAGTTAWTEVTGTGLPSPWAIEALEVDPLNQNIVYAGVGGFANGNLFRTANAGAASPVWVDIGRMATNPSDRLPDCPVNAIAVDPGYPNTIFVGTDVGLFRTEDGGNHWTTFDAGLPKTAVFDLVISTTAGAGGKMLAGTFGRGVWDLTISNDTCLEAAAVTDGSYSGSTGGAAVEGSSACDPGSGSPDVWYEYTATCDGNLSVDTCGSSFDTVVSLHNPGCPGTSTTENICNDQCGSGSCGTSDSCVMQPVSYGDSVLIRVSGRGGSSGTFNLKLSCEVQNETCDTAVQVSSSASITSGTRGAAWDNAPTCDAIDNTAPGTWYSVIGTGNTMTASLCNSPAGTHDSKLSVYCAGCAAPQCVAANDDTCSLSPEVSWCAAPGNIYSILVHGYQDQTGPFTLDISDNGTSCGPIYVNCDPGNDQCAGSQELPLNGITASNTDSSTDGTASCSVSASDIWFDYRPLCYGFATFDTCAGTGTLDDTVLSVHDSCLGNELGCNDDAPDNCPARRSRLTVTHPPDIDMKIRAASYYDGVSTLQGTFDLDVDETLAQLAAPDPGLYASGGENMLEDHLFRIDPEILWLTNIGYTGSADLVGLVYAQGLGLFYGVNDSAGLDQMVTIDPATGTATPFATLTYNAIRGLAYDPQEMVIYASEVATDSLLKIDPYSGETVSLGPIGFSGVEGLAWDPVMGRLFGSDIDTDQLLLIDHRTAAGSAVGSFGSGASRMEGLAYDSDELVLYGVHRPLTGSGALYRINTSTGEATLQEGGYADLDPSGLTYIEGLRSAVAELSFADQIPVSGGCPDYVFDNVSGLPVGLTASADGRITGSPVESGRYGVTFDVDDHDLSTPGITSAFMNMTVRPANDNAVHATHVGDVAVPFDSSYATTDGPDETAVCNFGGYSHIESDVWYCYQATCTGTLEAATCGSSFDTKMAIYNDCYVPGNVPANACNDDFCFDGASISMAVTAGSQYLVRVGGYQGAKGLGSLNLSCTGDPGGACCLTSSCIYTSSGDCAARGGTFQGAGSDCSTDGDGDGVSDACDLCPSDSRKTLPGICGCGIPDRDLDSDGTPDCNDLDDDGDGWIDPNDCEPMDWDTYPGAPEVNDGIDNQCPGSDPYGEGLVDEISGSAGFHNPADRNEFSWPGQRYATLYEVARSDDRWFVVCNLYQSPNRFWSDLSVPAPGGAYYYLVRAYAPYIGSWGRDSGWVERTLVCP